jgi:hypothetical protein
MAEGRDRRDPLASLAPLAKQARSIWAMLRQESNVDLGAIRLAGSSTSRHVELDVSVDGAPGSALGVMSQGEVNALALAVFLPRARLPASPSGSWSSTTRCRPWTRPRSTASPGCWRRQPPTAR